jgi:hypothetical protein
MWTLTEDYREEHSIYGIKILSKDYGHRDDDDENSLSADRS